MAKTALILCLLCLVCLLSGCTAARHGSDSLAEQGENATDRMGGAGASLMLPPGMSLGAPYTSALGEDCYEVIPGQAPAPPGRAICLRQQAWQLLPPIYMDIPAAGVRETKRP